MSHASVRPLYALLVASLLLPGTAFIGAGWLNWRQLETEARQQANATAAILHEHALKVFETHEVVLDWMEQRLRDVPWGEIARSLELHQDMRRVKGASGQLSSLLVVNPQGLMVANTRQFPLDPPVDVSIRDFFAASRREGARTYIGAPVLGRVSNLPILNVSRARVGADGRFDGVLAVAVLTSYFTDFYKTVGRANRDSVTLVREDGAVLARVPGLGDLPPVLAEDNPLMRHIRQADQGSYVGRSVLDGVERRYAFRRVGSYPLFVSCGLDMDAIRAIWHRNLALYGFFALLAAMSLFSVAWLALRRAQREHTMIAALAAEIQRREGVEAQLLQAQRMEAIGQMTGGVAHDFNNLLQALTGCLEMVGRRTKDPQVTRLTQAGIETVERGARLVRHLLAFARRQSLAPEPVDLGERINSMRDLLDRSLRADIRVDLDLPPDLWPLLADPNQLELAILNLAVNARDAMPKGGLLRLSARNVSLAPGDDPDGLVGDFVRFSVSDSGTGMPPEVQARAFEPFYTTKEVGKGSGMGLSMVYGFVRQSGGSVRLSSHAGEGTSVIIQLPRSAKAPAPRPTEITGVQTISPPGTILVVEDDEPVGAALEDILTTAGHRVRRARSAAEALAGLVDDAAVDLVLSDVMMPGGLTGLELAQEIRRNVPGLPVLLMTGFSNAITGAEADGFTVLSKPYRTEFLLKVVAETLDKARQGSGTAGRNDDNPTGPETITPTQRSAP